jgi:hypothetical protein
MTENVKKMNWINLRDNCCPNCDNFMIEKDFGYSLLCPICGFRLNSWWVDKILTDMKKTKKWGYCFRDEVEINLTGINNL